VLVPPELARRIEARAAGEHRDAQSVLAELLERALALALADHDVLDQELESAAQAVDRGSYVDASATIERLRARVR
jgi:hypothetical protein